MPTIVYASKFLRLLYIVTLEFYSIMPAEAWHDRVKKKWIIKLISNYILLLLTQNLQKLRFRGIIYVS